MDPLSSEGANCAEEPVSADPLTGFLSGGEETRISEVGKSTILGESKGGTNAQDEILQSLDDESSAIVIGGFAIDDDDECKEDLTKRENAVVGQDAVVGKDAVEDGSEAITRASLSSVGAPDSGSPQVTLASIGNAATSGDHVVPSRKASANEPCGGGVSVGKGGFVTTTKGKNRILTPLDPDYEGPFSDTGGGGASSKDSTSSSAGSAVSKLSSTASPSRVGAADRAFISRGLENAIKSASEKGSAFLARASAAASSTIQQHTDPLQNQRQQSRHRVARIHAQQSAAPPGVAGDGAPKTSMADKVNQISALSGKFTATSHAHSHDSGKGGSGAEVPSHEPCGNDPETQSRFIRNALGELLPGEKVIMFLSRVTHVADSRSTVSGVASSSSITSRVDVGGGGSGRSSGKTSVGGNVMYWCCVMTFYRVALFNYREEAYSVAASATALGKGRGEQSQSCIAPAVDDDDASALARAVKHEEVGPKADAVVKKPLVRRSSSGVGAASGIDSAVDRGGLSRQWQHCHGVVASSPTSAKSALGYRQHILQMPLGSIDRVEKGSESTVVGPIPSPIGAGAGGVGTGGGATASYNLTLVLYGKDGRWIRFTTQSLGDCIRAHEALSTYAFPGKRNLGYLFAFESCREKIMSGAMSGTDNRRFDPVREYARMGVEAKPQPKPLAAAVASGGKVGGNGTTPKRPWTLTRANINYKVIMSYPSHIVVPNQAAEEFFGEKGLRLLKQTAAFRSEGRVPAFTWGSDKDAASIWRSSQPRVGIGSNRSVADEMYLQHIAEAARPFRGTGNRIVIPPAYARLLSGATDSESDVLSYLQMVDGGAGIGMGSGGGVSGRPPSPSSAGGPIPPLKIMDLRPKSSAMANRTQGYGYESSNNYPCCKLSFFNIGNIHVVRDSSQKLQALAQSPVTNDVQWTSLVESTQWLSHIRHILNASWYLAAQVHFHRLPVLVHCSHGWDRTSQVCALAQLFLDPFYRTMDGFAVLVEKDFCSFGYPFHLRAGHGESNENGGQRAPVFIQFLDCVWQLVNLFPSFFEFNGRYLLAVADHVYSCRFGTLLCDNERERASAAIYERTLSLWDYLDCFRTSFTCATYNRVNNVLLPPLPCILRRVSLWTDYHLMFSPKACTPCIPRDLVCFVHGYRGNVSSLLATGLKTELSAVSKGESKGFEGATPVSVTANGGGHPAHSWSGTMGKPLPPELQILHCVKDEADAALSGVLYEAEQWRERALEQQREIERLKRRLEEMGATEKAPNSTKQI